jgi:pteridine reductase
MRTSVLITGGTSDIGQAITRNFLKNDWFVHLHYHQSDHEAKTLKDSHPNSIKLHQANLNDSSDCESLAEEVLEDEALTVLINNAALFSRNDRNDPPETESWDRPMNVNARAPWTLSRLLSEQLTRNDGSIVNLTDAALNRPYSDYLPYFASKGALETLTRGLARALSPEIRVNGVAPGPIDFPDDYSESDRQQVLNKTLLERQGTHEEIAETSFFLAVNASYTTGSILEVDGGRHLN